MPFAEIRGLTVHYRVSGPRDAPRAVFLNSLGTDCRIWDDVVAEFRGQFRVLLYDQRGQGLTDSPPAPYSVSDHARDLLGLLDRLKWGPTALCGLSIGGMIAMRACAQQPRAILGLVLADTSDVIGPREFWDGRIGDVRSNGLRTIAGSVMERWFGDSYRGERAVEARGWSNLLAQASVEGYVGSCAALRDADLSDIVAKIAVPALCICGSEDASTPPTAVRSLARRLPRAEYAEMPGAGHLTPVECPCEFASMVRRFLGGTVGNRE